MYRVYICLALVYFTQAQIPSFGFCPDYLPMAHFDINRFLGKWYEAERYFQFSEVAARCVVTDYAVGPNGKIYVSNEVTNRFTGVKRIIGGNLDLTGKKTEGRLVVKYDTQPISTTSALTILDTDYENYAVIWSCNGLGPVNAQNAWLMTRERIPDTTTLQTAYGVLDRYKISRTFFVKTDQEGCAIAASDLNAALGIASTSTNVEQNADIDNGKGLIKSAEVKPQTIPDILLTRAEEEKSTQGTKQISKSVDDVTKSSPEDSKPVEKIVAKAADEPIINVINKNPEDSKNLIDESQELKENPASVLGSVQDVIQNKDCPAEYVVQTQDILEDEEKDRPDTTTSRNSEN